MKWNMKKLQTLLAVLTAIFCIQAAFSAELLAQSGEHPSLLVSTIELDNIQNSRVIPLARLLSELEQEFDATFLFKDEVVASKFVSRSTIGGGKDTGLKLSAILDDLGLTYNQIDEQTFVLLPKNAVPEEVQLQERVTGTVTDAASGETMPGVNVLVKGTSTGTATDINGEYQLMVESLSDTLVFSFIGYETVTVPINGRSVISVQLQMQTVSGQEIVVVGYGEQERVSVVGSISTTTSEQLQKMGTPNLGSAIAGRVTGVTAMVGSGRPGGDDAEIYIRGVATLNAANSTPLILVDGVERPLSRVNPEDIESFSILKDASATAVYGVRGANGVILITTKRGRSGAPTINVRYNTTLQQPVRLPKFLGAYDHARLRNHAQANDGVPQSFTDQDLELFRTGSSPYTHPDNDYAEDFLRKVTPMHKAYVSISGGTERLRYFMSTNATFQDGIYKQFEEARYPSNAYYKDLNLRSNLDYDLTSSTELSIDLDTRIERNQNVSEGDGVGSNIVFSQIMRTPPHLYPYRLPNGYYGGNLNEPTGENLMAILNDWGHNVVNDNVLEGTLRLRQKLDFVIPGLSLRGLTSFNSYYRSGTKLGNRPATYSYNPATEEYTLVEEEIAQWTSTLPNRHRRRSQMEFGMDWKQQFAEHDVSAMLLYTQTKGFTNHTLPVAFVGYVGRVTYSYMDRYLSEVNFGYNGSDQFEAENRFGFFPSFSLGWIVSQESFLRDRIPALSFLKLRGSYGLVGNDKIGSDRFLFLQTFDPGDNYWFGTDDNLGSYPTIYEGAMGNENVTWEVGKKTNIGIDVMFFKDKLSLNMDLFREDRERIFIQRSAAPTILGVGLPQENIGAVRNEGFEIETRYQGQAGNVSYFLDGKLSYSKNTVVNTDEIPPEFDYMARTGKPVGQNFGLKVLGYYTPDDFVDDGDGNLTLKEGLPVPTYGPFQPGDFKYWDRNGDGIIDNFDEGPIGNSRIPRYEFGFSAGMNYKGWDFSMLWQGSAGHHKFITSFGAWEPVRDRDRFMEHHLYSWTEERWKNGEEIRYPLLHASQNSHNHRNNSFFQKRGDYLRLKNIEIGYNIPTQTLSSVGIQSLRVYATGTNLLTFSDIKNFDPEVGSTSGLSYPQMRLWTLGLNIKL